MENWPSYGDIVGVAGSIPAAPTIYLSEFVEEIRAGANVQHAFCSLNKPRTVATCPPKLGNSWAKCSTTVHRPSDHQWKFSRSGAEP